MKKNILAIGCHCDDIVIGAGGTLAKYAASGHKVYGVTLTDSETHYRARNIHRTKEAAFSEECGAAQIIGYEVIDCKEIQCANGCLRYNVEVMRYLEETIHSLEIDTVFTHWKNDLNMDHSECYRIVGVAARHVGSLFTFRTNWYTDSTSSLSENSFSDITGTVEIKKRALFSYKSEIANRGEEWIQSFLEYNRIIGGWNGCGSMEAFECIKQKLEI